MKSSIIKALFGTLGASGLAVGGYYGFQAMKNETILKNGITEKLIENKYEILTVNQENNNHWDAILLSYKSAPQDLKFGEIKGSETNALNKLQELCKEILKPSITSNIENTNNYKKTEKWCVKPVTISEILKARGISAFNLDNGDKTTNKKDWENKIKAHKSSTETNKKITLLSLSDGVEANEEDITKIKAQCTTISNKKNHEDKYDEFLSKFENWCTNK